MFKILHLSREKFAFGSKFCRLNRHVSQTRFKLFEYLKIFCWLPPALYILSWQKFQLLFKRNIQIFSFSFLFFALSEVSSKKFLVIFQKYMTPMINLYVTEKSTKQR